MIVKRFVYKSGVVFKRVEYDPGSYLCKQYECKYREGDIRSYDPICDLCSYVRHRFAYIKNMYIPNVS